jgi:TPP-dependent pyruvate/acetoin dehydrogenase alpha subunit
MLEEWARKDPLSRFRQVLRERGAAAEKEIDDIDTLAKDYAATEADLAVKDPMPDPATVTRGVYAGDDFAEPRLELVRSPFSS